MLFCLFSSHFRGRRLLKFRLIQTIEKKNNRVEFSKFSSSYNHYYSLRFFYDSSISLVFSLIKIIKSRFKSIHSTESIVRNDDDDSGGDDDSKDFVKNKKTNLLCIHIPFVIQNFSLFAGNPNELYYIFSINCDPLTLRITYYKIYSKFYQQFYFPYFASQLI